MSKRNLRPIKLGLVVGSREFFNGAPALQTRAELLQQLERLNVASAILPVDATKNGAVQSREDARRYAAFFRDERDPIDGLVICLPNFGDEIAISELVNEARLDVPILLQASNDEIDKVDVKSRRDAFCGKFSVANNFYQYGVPFTDTTSHTCDVGGAEFAADLDRFVRVCRVARGPQARADRLDRRPHRRLPDHALQREAPAGVGPDRRHGRSFRDHLRRQRALRRRAGGQGEARGDRAPTGGSLRYIKPEKVVRQAKWTLAVDRWIEENECDASAIQCWRSLQDNFGCATCLTMSMMGEKLTPSACEVDVMGAISMYALALAAEAPSAILDWNNNYGREPDKCVCTHCGNYPKSFIGETPEISELDVLGSVLGKENCFGAVKGKVQPGPMTFFRASTDDRLGTVKAYVGEGEFTADPFGMDGGIAVTKVARLRPLLGFIARNGFEHHVAMVRGRHADAVREAVTRYLNWPIYRHEAEPGGDAFGSSLFRG